MTESIFFSMLTLVAHMNYVLRMSIPLGWPDCNIVIHIFFALAHRKRQPILFVRALNENGRFVQENLKLF